MNWVKIEPGCEMPEQEEYVLIAHRNGFIDSLFDSGVFRYWRNGDEFPDGDGFAQGYTHWARVELPNN